MIKITHTNILLKIMSIAYVHCSCNIKVYTYIFFLVLANRELLTNNNYTNRVL